MIAQPSKEIITPPPVLLPEAFEFLRKPKRVKIIFGGRDSAKTESVGRQICLNMESSETPYRVVAARMFMNSIDDSLYSMFNEFNTDYQFGFDTSANKIRNHRNDSRVSFFGIARNVKAIKSRFKPDVFLLDEGDEVTGAALDIIVPTFRKAGSEIWIVFNPNDKSDAVWKRWVAPVIQHIERDGYFEDQDVYIKRVNYDQNPFLTDTSKREIFLMKENNPKKYDHIYGGEPKGIYENAIIQPEWVDAAIDAHIKLGFEGLGERVGSLDIADQGSDSKCYVERKGVVVERLTEWDDGDFNTCIERGIQYATEDEVDNLVYDHDGMGRDVNVFLQVRNVKHKFEIEGFAGGGPVDEPDEYYDDAERLDEENRRVNKEVFRNKRAQYYFGLADRFYRTWLAVEKRQYIDPQTLISLSGDLEGLMELRSELIKIPEKKTAGSRLKQIMAKSDMKSKLGIASPNKADALMMSFSNSPVDDSGPIETLPPVNYY